MGEEEESFKYLGPESLYATNFLPTPRRSAKDYCLRSMNGTKMYMRNPNGSQIHEFVFPMSANCEPLEYVGYRWYANYISNASMAFSISIVALQEPRRLAIDMYEDHCHHLIEERYLYEAQCE